MVNYWKTNGEPKKKNGKEIVNQQKINFDLIVILCCVANGKPNVNNFYNIIEPMVNNGISKQKLN